MQKRLAAQRDEVDLGLVGQSGIERVTVGLDATDGGRVAAGEEEDARTMGHSGTRRARPWGRQRISRRIRLFCLGLPPCDSVGGHHRRSHKAALRCTGDHRYRAPR